MRAHDLIDALGDSAGPEYLGDPRQILRGFTERYSPASVRRRFFVLVDAGWTRKSRQMQLPEGTMPEDVVHQAFANGASGVVCSPDLRGSRVLEGRNVFFTDATFDFLLCAAAFTRSTLTDHTVTAVTGSAGKSTTKAMITHALKALEAGSVLAAAGNTNLAQHVASQLTRSHRNTHTVLEVAGSAFQRYEPRGFAVSPDVAIITAVSEAHLDYLHDLESVARIKSDLFLSPPPGGSAVVNIDTPHADLLVARAQREGWALVTYGEAAGADLRLIDYAPEEGLVVAEINGERLRYTVGAPGRHMALNSLAVIAALRALGLEQWRDGVRSLAAFAPLGGRGEVAEVTLASGACVTLIDEAYNANPVSVRAALDLLSSRAVTEGGRRVAVLGDILELGDGADQIHRSLSDAVLRAGVHEVHLFGTHMAALYDEVRDQGLTVQHWSDLEEMSAALLTHLRTGDIVLTKASGETGLKDFVKEIVRAHS